MASSSPAGNVIYVEAKPTDGGVYKLIDGSWYCCLCSAFAPESHLWCRNHLWYVEQYRAGKLRPIQALEDMPAAWTAPPPRSAPPPPPRGQQTDGLSGPPPAPAPAAVSEENVILVKLHVKLDIILDKLQSVEARLAEIELALGAWAWGEQ
jgi:hypothetical protein